MQALATFALAATLIVTSSFADAEDEITLFDGRGMPSAYVAASDDLTIYLWGGKPVAYLDRDDASGFHVYGFNGKHLGWLVGGIVRDHDGNAACAVREILQFVEFEPFKAFKQFKPFKAFKVFAPFRPFFSTSWSSTPCVFLLAEGAT